MIRTGENISYLFKSIEITQDLLPEFFGGDVLKEAKEYQARFGFHLAQGLLANGEIPAAISQIREALKGCQSPQVLKVFADLLNRPESSQLLPGLAQLFVNADTEQFLLPPAVFHGYNLHFARTFTINHSGVCCGSGNF